MLSIITKLTSKLHRFALLNTKINKYNNVTTTKNNNRVNLIDIYNKKNVFFSSFSLNECFSLQYYHKSTKSIPTSSISFPKNCILHSLSPYSSNINISKSLFNFINKNCFVFCSFSSSASSSASSAQPQTILSDEFDTIIRTNEKEAQILGERIHNKLLHLFEEKDYKQLIDFAQKHRMQFSVDYSYCIVIQAAALSNNIDLMKEWTLRLEVN